MSTGERRFIVPSPGWRGVIAVFAASCVIVAACGSGDSELAEEFWISAPGPSAQDGPEYGDSLEEWTEATEGSSESASESRNEIPYPPGFELLTWDDLVPPGYTGDEIYSRYTDRLAEVEDGSPEANEIYAQMQAEFDAGVDVVNAELDGAKVNLAGFVAPLTYEDDIVTEFLLVPYFGACIHVPPPPPNQTILVKIDKANGLTVDESWGAVWVAGSLTVDAATTDLATASYAMTATASGVYDEYG